MFLRVWPVSCRTLGPVAGFYEPRDPLQSDLVSQAVVKGKNVGSCLGDLFSVNWMEDDDLGKLSTETFKSQIAKVRKYDQIHASHTHTHTRTCKHKQKCKHKYKQKHALWHQGSQGSQGAWPFEQVTKLTNKSHVCSFGDKSFEDEAIGKVEASALKASGSVAATSGAVDARDIYVTQAYWAWQNSEGEAKDKAGENCSRSAETYLLLR